MMFLMMMTVMMCVLLFCLIGHMAHLSLKGAYNQQQNELKNPNIDKQICFRLNGRNKQFINYIHYEGGGWWQS